MFFWISTAVACRAGNTCTMYCWMEDPSLEAKYLSSARAARKPKAAKTLGSFLMMSVALCIGSSFSSTATANGSFSNVDLQRSVYALVETLVRCIAGWKTLRWKRSICLRRGLPGSRRQILRFQRSEVFVFGAGCQEAEGREDL